MLDTIILQIETSKCAVIDYGRFGTTKEQVLNTGRGFRKWFNNPTAKDKADGIYLPRMTLMKRGWCSYLKIEFSAPKLLYGNNIEELEDNNFDEVINTLQERMKNMGVYIWTKIIEDAEIISFHPSKNIQLNNGYTASLAIKELSKIDLSKQFDFDEKNYRNNGEALQLYSNSHSFVIYDKITDLIKPKKRATDKDQTNKQTSIFEFIKSNENKMQLLRLEIRLSHKRKLNEVMQKLGYAPNPQFKDIFKKELCQKIVNLYWTDFFSDNNFLFSTTNNPLSIFQLLLVRFPKIGIIKAIKLVGLYMLCRDDDGIRGFRQVVNAYKSISNWQAVKRDIQIFEDEIFSKSLLGFIKDIKEQLNKFNSIKLKL